MRNPKAMILIRSFAIEVLIYAALAIGCFVLVLRLLVHASVSPSPSCLSSEPFG